MPRPTTNGIDDFFKTIKAVRKIAAISAGGLILLPFIADVGGYLPPWPPGIVSITGVVEIAFLILCYQGLYGASRKATLRFMLISAVGILLFSVIYMVGNSLFVYKVPGTATVVTLGCGLSEKSKEILNSSNLSISDECPGEFDSLLSSAQYETGRVWKKSSVSLVNVGLAVSWLGAFASFALLLGSFATFQARRSTRR